MASTSSTSLISFETTTPPPGSSVLPRDAEVVSVEHGTGLEPEPPHLAAALVPDPVGRRPLPEVGDLEGDLARDAPQGQVGHRPVVVVTGALDEATAKGDRRVVLDIEEVRGAQMRVAVGLTGPDAGRVDLAPEGRAQRILAVELDLAVDVLEQASDPGDHRGGRGTRPRCGPARSSRS